MGGVHTPRGRPCPAARQGNRQLRRNVQRTGQEHAQVTHGYQLHGEPEPDVVPSAGGDQPSIFIIEVTEPLQLLPRQSTEPAVATIIGHDDMKSPQGQGRSIVALTPDLTRLLPDPLRPTRGDLPQTHRWSEVS